MHHFAQALLLAALVCTTIANAQFIKSANYYDASCQLATPRYTVFSSGKCETLSALGISSSTVNRCGSNSISTSRYLGDSCDGSTTSQVTNSLNQCVQDSDGNGGSEITCPAAFPYTANNASDSLIVTFEGSSCQGTVYNIVVSLGGVSNTSRCGTSSCRSSLLGTSTRSICGSSTDLPNYVKSLSGATNLVVGMLAVIAVVLTL